MATGTRGAVKQQSQQEEQTSTILAVLQEQAQRQAKLVEDQAARFNVHLEQFAEMQQQRYVELTQQVGKQLEELSQDQKQGWQNWNQLEERLKTLEQDLQSVKLTPCKVTKGES